MKPPGDLDHFLTGYISYDDKLNKVDLASPIRVNRHLLKGQNSKLKNLCPPFQKGINSIKKLVSLAFESLLTAVFP